MMRSLSLVCVVVVGSACAAEVDGPPAPAASVRERLERGETRMLVSSGESAGAITAARRVSDGWESGLVDLTLDSGEVVVSANDRGAVTLDRLGLAVAPIEIPPTVLSHGATLTNVRVDLAAPVFVDAEWIDDNELHATLALDVELTWSLTIDGSTSPLGSPDLPAVAADLTVTGDGETVQSELRIHAPGELWSWASLVRLEDLELILSARTPDAR